MKHLKYDLQLVNPACGFIPVVSAVAILRNKLISISELL